MLLNGSQLNGNTLGSYWAWGIGHPDTYADANTTGLPVRWRLVENKVIPAVSQSYTDAGKITKIAVVQQYATSQILGQARTRLLDSTWLMRSASEGLSSTEVLNSKYWFIRGVDGIAAAESVDKVVPERTRIVAFALVAEADSLAAPTFTFAGNTTSDSYNEAQSIGEATDNVRSRVLRFPKPVSLAASSSGLLNRTHCIRGVQAANNGVALLELNYRVNEWNFMQAKTQPVNIVSMYATVITPMAPKLLIGSGETSAINRVIAWYNNEKLFPEVQLSTVAGAHTYMKGAYNAYAVIGGEGIASKGVLMVSDLLGESSTEATMQRIITFNPVNLEAAGSVARLVYAINLHPGNRAPDYRTLVVPYNSRTYVIDSENREVRIQ